jgi:hypothetical protein
VPEQVGLAVTGQLEDAAADGEHSRLLVADDETCCRRGVVVLQQLEQEAESAASARGRVLREALARIVVDRALFAVGTDEERHG